MLGCQSRTKTLAYRSPILLPHQLQYFLSKFHFMSMVRGPTHTAMLQPCGALLPISPPQSLRLPVAHLQELAGIYDPQMLAPHTRQHFHPSQLLLAHLCPPQSDLLSEVLLPKSGVKFALFVQMWPKIDGLDPRFMQQSIKLHKTRFSSPAVLTDELGAVSCRSTQQ